MGDSSAKRDLTPQRHLLRGSIWTIGLRWSVRLMGLISTVVLARLLTPADYGIVAIAALIVGMVEMFSETGQTIMIIRHPNPTREHYDSAWTISLLIGLAGGVIVFLLAPLTTAYFHEPRVKPVVEILAFRTMLQGFLNIGVVNFRRNLQFHRQFQFNVWTMLISFIVTLIASLILRNYWGLVIGLMARHAANVALSYAMEPFRPRISFSKVREIWSFSFWTWLRSMGAYLNEQVDKLAIGGFAGAASMGRFEVARDLGSSPSMELVTPVVLSVLPVMAKVQDDKVQRRKLYLTVLEWSALICVSTGIGVALVAQEMADLILGPQWHDVAPLMRWLALAYGILGFSNSVYQALDAIGRPATSARLQGMRLFALALTIAPVAYYTRNLEYVAITRLAVTIAVTPALFWALARAFEIPLRDFVAVLWRPIAAGLVMAGIVLMVRAVTDVTGPLRLLVDVTIGVASFGTALMLCWFAAGRPAGVEAKLWELLSPRLEPIWRRLQSSSRTS